MKSLEQQLHEMSAELAAAKGQKTTTTAVATLKESFIAAGMSEEDAEIAAVGSGKKYNIFEEGRR
jgi:hypothetical protein